jgi:hypothetical protein
LNTFGLDYLKSGSGILDVAGGKGEVSFEIINLNGIQSTVFDPRPLDLYRYKRKLQFGYYHRNEMFECYNPLPPIPAHSHNILAELTANEIEQGDNNTCRLPQHIRGFFEMFDSYKTGSPLSNHKEGTFEELTPCSLLPLALHSSNEFEEQLNRSKQTRWTEIGLQHEDEGALEDPDLDGDEDEEQEKACDSNVRRHEMVGGSNIDSYEEAVGIVRNCSVVIGMHPDQVPQERR